MSKVSDSEIGKTGFLLDQNRTFLIVAAACHHNLIPSGPTTSTCENELRKRWGNMNRRHARQGHSM